VQVHHLNCGTLFPLGCGELVCHVLLVEAANGLVLVDTGFGLADCADPGWRVGPSRYFIRPVLNPAEAAVNQIELLGFRRDDVRHVVITHFDGDHIGGISDFPDAQIHVTAAEWFAATRTPSRKESSRYRPALWAHGPKIVEHTPAGEKWRGFAAAKELAEVSPGIALVWMPGHTRGHVCVAVDAGHRWVLHCGDAFFHHGTVDGTARMPRALDAFERVTAFDRKRMRQNHSRLAELHQRGEPEMLVVCSHDRTLYQQAKATT
jgi:glyoxylase-like metal-dependent hydrolase (beta-lactamase superfamily II)